MSLEKVIIEYGVELSALKKDFADLKSTVTKVDAEVQQSSKNTQKSLDDLGATVKGKVSDSFAALGKQLAITFSITAITAFAKSCIDVANIAKDVKESFNRLNDPLLLTKLRSAVKGTLSDLTLMKEAVKADNLQIPLKNLAQLFEFAKLRADQTGKSTEELVDTIINGIGVKSTRALVQLGISQNQFGSEVKKTGDYFTALGTIIDKEMKDAGEQVEDTGDKVEQLNANIQNLKASIGEKLLPVQNAWLESLNFIATAFQNLTPVVTYGNLQRDLADNYKKGLDVISPFVAFVEREGEAYSNLNDALLPYLASAKEYVYNIESQGAAAEQAARRFDPLYTNYLRQIDVLTKYVAGQEKQQKSEDDLTGNINTNTAAVEKQTKSYITLGQIMGIVFSNIEKTSLAIGSTVEPIQMTNDELVKLLSTALLLDDHLADSSVNWQEYWNGVQSTSEEATQKLQEDLQNYLYFTSSILDSVNQAYQQSSDYKMNLLDVELEQGKISQEQYDQESKKLKTKEAKRDKEFAMFNIIVSTAQAIISALAMLPPNVPLSVLAGITGATQLGVVASQPIPKFAKGGLPEGKNAIVMVNEEGQEFIANARATRKYQKELEAMNKGKFEQYINKYYKTDAGMTWDDYRLRLEIMKTNKTSVHNTERLIQALKENRKAHRF